MTGCYHNFLRGCSCELFFFCCFHPLLCNLQKPEFKSLLSWCATKKLKESLGGKILALAIWSSFSHCYSVPGSEKKKSLYPMIPYLIKTRLFYPNSQATLLNSCIDFSPWRVRSERSSLKDYSERRAILLLLPWSHAFVPEYYSSRWENKQRDEGPRDHRQQLPSAPHFHQGHVSHLHRESIKGGPQSCCRGGEVWLLLGQV